MKDKLNEKEAERVFKALANRRRVAIVSMLNKKKTASVGEIAKIIKLSFSSTSKHLQILASVGIVDKDQVGLTMFYSISKNIPKLILHLISIL